MKLVVGGCGFIGSALVKSLAAAGAPVAVVDNLVNGNEDVLTGTGAKFHNVDIRNRKELLALPGHFDEIYHMAANYSVKLSNENPSFDFDENVNGTFNVLELARKHDAKVVLASSSTVYGVGKAPLKESSPCEPISFYGVSKLAGERYCQAYSKVYGLKTAALRYFNVYGPLTNHGVMYDFMKKLEKNPKELEILGTGAQVKDYVYIEDAVGATLVAMKNAREFEAYNVGTGRGTTTRHIAELVSKNLGLSPKFKFTGGISWSGDVELSISSIAKLRRLGWQPKVPIEDGVSAVVSSHKA